MPTQVSRLAPGVTFALTIVWPATLDADREAKAALRDWLLFGGIGGRTRRGCGGLRVVKPDDRNWLELPTTAQSLASFGAPGGTSLVAAHIPQLAGAEFRCSTPGTDAVAAWRLAHGWLRSFRQGADDQLDPNEDARGRTSGDFARSRPQWRPGAPGREVRPGQSRWPEADEIRRAFAPFARGFAHKPDYAGPLTWPRANFGLPIQVQFQARDRANAYYVGEEPPNVALGWTDRPGNEIIQRLPSPLILKSMQLRDGRFVSLALWLTRSMPANARVGIVQGNSLKAGSDAAFSTMPGPPATLLFTPLVAHASVRDAFLAWLRTQQAPVGGRL